MTRIWYSFEHPDHGEIEVELDCDVASAEPAVGIFNDYLDGWEIIGRPKDCPLSKEEIANILEHKTHADAIEEKAIQKASDDCYDHEEWY